MTVCLWSSQFHGGRYVGENSDGDLYKGIVVFMIVGLKESIPYVVKTCPEVSINGNWLRNEIDSSIYDLKKCGFNVRAVVCDNHSANVCAFTQLLHDYPAESELYIHHPAYNGSMKTYIFYDMVHLIKNVRNNLLNAKMQKSSYFLLLSLLCLGIKLLFRTDLLPGLCSTSYTNVIKCCRLT